MDKSFGREFLETAIRRLRYYKELGEKTFEQLEAGDFHLQPNDASNSIAVIIRHMSGNMLSRWTNFLTEDGEKSWRNRDEEFENSMESGVELMNRWNQGWNCFLNALESLEETDLLKKVKIRGEELTVTDAINRQLAHYPYHVGQIVYLGRLIRNQDWKSLSIPKGASLAFNQSSGPKDPARNK